MEFKSCNELSLQIRMSHGEVVYTKAGAFIGGESYGGKNYQFEKVLLGPQGNPLAALAGQVMRRFTGENLPLMKVTAKGDCVTYYANLEQHVTVVPLGIGERLSVESENLLAFSANCKYTVKFLAQGVISQKGFATSVIEGTAPGCVAAILTEGNPLVLSNTQNGAYLTADPDAVVAWVGADPGFKLDLSWKNIIGQASGESYMFEWTKPANIIIQPSERKSGLDISMDGSRTGQHAQGQQNQSLGSAAGGLGNTMSTVGNVLGGGTPTPTGGGGGLLGQIGNLFNGM